MLGRWSKIGGDGGGCWFWEARMVTLVMCLVLVPSEWNVIMYYDVFVSVFVCVLVGGK